MANNNPQFTGGYSRCPIGTWEAIAAVGAVLIFLMFVIFFLLVTIIAFTPHSLPVFRVNNASLSNFNVSSLELRSNWEFDLLVRNPNSKFTFNYEQINASVFFRDKLVTQKLLPPFHQKKKTNNNVTFSFSMDSSVYLDEARGREIISELDNNVVSFDLRMSIRETYKYMFAKEREVVNVSCENIRFKLSSNSTSSSDGIMLGETNECQVKSDEDDESDSDYDYYYYYGQGRGQGRGWAH